jgi:hypothetical protein
MGRNAAAALSAAILFGLAAVAAIAGTGAGGGMPAEAAFRLEDGSAGCNYRASGEIACRAAGAAAAVVLAPDGQSRLDPDTVVDWDEQTTVLLASESWWNGDVSCRVRAAGIACAAGDGAIATGDADHAAADR